jgi:hypothetical protein
MRRPLPLSELIAAVGDDKIKIEPVNSNITDATAVKRRGPNNERLTRITLLTSMLAPHDLLGLTEDPPRSPEMTGLLIWLPTADVERVKKDYA